MKTEVMTMDPISGVDMGKVQTQVPPAQESRQLGRHFVLAYVGAWAFVYDRAISLYQGTLKLITDAEKRGEGMESALSKKMNRFQRQANRQRDTIQEPLSAGAEQGTRNLGDAGETLEERLEKQVERVLANLGIPTRDRLERLNQEIDRLNAKLDEELARQLSAGA